MEKHSTIAMVPYVLHLAGDYAVIIGISRVVRNVFVRKNAASFLHRIWANIVGTVQPNRLQTYVLLC